MTNPSTPGNSLSAQPNTPVQGRRVESWSNVGTNDAQDAIKRRMRIGMIASCVIAVSVLLWWQLFEPFRHNNAHLLLVSGERRVTDDGSEAALSSETELLLSESERVSPAADFVAEDFLAFQSLKNLFSLRSTNGTSTARNDIQELLDLRRLQTTLDQMTTDASDVLVVYLAARTRVEDGDASLEFNVRNGFINEAQCRLEDVLKKLSRSNAAVKLLIVDAGTFERDPAHGMVLNEFPLLLEHAVEQVEDPSLWVLSSNRSLERSHVSRALERTVFNWFVVLGLNGAADFNLDLQIDLDELSRYVTTEVSEFVRQTTGGTESQTPFLMWGGGSTITHMPVLLPVVKQKGKSIEANDPERWLQSSPPQSVGSAILSVPASPVTFTLRSDIVTEPAQIQSRLVQRVMPTSLGIRGLGTISANPSAKSPKAAPAGQASDATAPNSTDSGPSSDKDSDQTKSSDGAAASGKTDKKIEPDPKVAIELASLFIEAWGLRDDLERNPWYGLNPSKSAPEEWRQLVEKLLLQERLFRAGRISDQRQISNVVKTARDGLRALSRNDAFPFRTGQDARISELIRRIWDRMNQQSCNALRAHSLGLTELLARRTGQPIDATVQAAITRLDELIELGTASEFQEWVEKLEPPVADFVETQFARRLAAKPDLSWTTKQFALRVCRIAEKTASINLNCAAWIAPEFEEAERLRKIGERTLFDRIGQDRETEGINRLRQALPKYQRAANDLVEIQIAELVCDQLMMRLPQYVRWHNESNRHAVGTPQTADIRRLADDLAQLVSRLDAPEPGQLTEIQSLSMRLSSLQEKIEAELSPSQIGSRLQNTTLPGDHLQMESLLNTTLPTGGVRLSLLQKLIEIDRRNVGHLDLPQTFPPIALNHARVATDWEWALRTLELELIVPQLGAIHVPGLQTELTVINQNWKDLKDTSVGSQWASRETGDPLWEKYRRLSSGLERFYQNWVAQIAADVNIDMFSSDLSERVRQRLAVRSARRGLQLIPVKSMVGDEGSSPTTLLEQSDAYNLLTWHAARYDRLRLGAARDESVQLAQLVRSYRTQAAMIPHQPPLTHTISPQIEWVGTESVSLETVSEQSIELRLKWTGARKTPAWVRVHYDPEMIDVKSGSEMPVTLRAKTAFDEPEISPNHPPTFEISPENPPVFRLSIRSRDNAMGSSNLVVYASTNEGLARKDISISLPTRPSVEIAINGVSGSFSNADGKLRLHPFANRLTSYSLGLINHEPVPREVSLKWLAPRRPFQVDIPKSELSARDAANIFDSIGPMETLVEVASVNLPADDKAVKIPFPKPEGESPPATAPMAPYGLILVITDQKTDRSLVKIVDIAPQRPKRFLRPLVRYSADRERIDVTVVPIDKTLIPPEGVKVSADFLEPLSDDSTRELEGEIVAPKFESKLFAEVANRADKVMTLRLSVDGYPRAFTFRVPCHANTGNLAEVTDRMAVSITSPQPQSAYQSPLNDLPVELFVDAPDGAFQIPGDVLEVGIDRNNDRDFRDEPTLVLTTDRQVEVKQIQFRPEGVFNLFVSIGDFKVRVPAAGVRNANTQLLSRLIVSDRTVWSRPVPVIFDGALPRIKKMRLSPSGPVVIGGPLKLFVNASDNDLSGIAKVEAAFDLDRTGLITATAKIIPAELNSEGNWVAEIPTAELKPGQYTLLVRAIDRVGNVGDPTKLKLTAMTAEEATKAASVPVSITGLVVYADQPAAEILISAEMPDGPEITAVQTNDSGQFRLKGLVPGKWKIRAKGVVRNKTRMTELEVTIKPSEIPPPIKFTLK